MCLAIPAKVVKIDEEHATVDYGGTRRIANISLVDARVGDYVLIHAGFAIQIIDEEDARETINIFREMLSNDASFEEN